MATVGDVYFREVSGLHGIKIEASARRLYLLYNNRMINTVVHGDCLVVMKSFEDGCIDLTVTSPPYDNLRDYKGYVFDFEGIARELYRVTKQGGVVVWVVGDATVKGSETGTSFRQALYFKEIGFNLHDTMIYQKSGFMPSKTRYCQNFEYMFIFSKGKPIFNPLRDRKNNWAGSTTGNVGQRQVDGTIKKRGKKLIGEYGMRSNIWKIINEGGWLNKDPLTLLHPATFPEKLAEDHILSWSNEGDTVFDPMAGSGTTLKMAKKNNRNYIGIETSQEYIDIINKRLGK